MCYGALRVMWAALAAVAAVAVAGQLHVDPEVKCLELSCHRLQWCSRTQSACKNCSDVCDVQSREYAQTTCDGNCQAYLHELRFQRKGESAGTVELAGRVSTLTTLLVLCVCGLIGCVLWIIYHTACVHRASCRRSAVVDCNCSINEKHNKPNNNKILKLMRWGGSVSAAGTCAVTAGYNSSRPNSVRISRDVSGARSTGLSLGDTSRRLPSESSCPAEDDGDAIYANLAFCPSPTDVSIANRPLPEPGVPSATARGADREVDITDMSSAPVQCSV